MLRNTTSKGRVGNVERIRELIALLGSLSRTGDTVTIEALSTRLGISLDDARTMMNIVCQASGEETGGLLISSNDTDDVFTLQYPGIHGRPVRLTNGETIAVLHGLDMIGLPEDDPLRLRLRMALSSTDVQESLVRQSLGSAANDTNLHCCARSVLEQRELVCLYAGMLDTTPKERHIAVRHITNEHGAWYVRAYDLDQEDERTFRVDRMHDARLLNTVLIPPENPSVEQRVTCTFTSLTYYEAFSWPALHVTRKTSKGITGSITYYKERSTWLLRRICACEGTFLVHDKSIMTAAREYARSLVPDTLM